MTLSAKPLQDGFWEKFQIREKDIEFLFNHLIEVEEPLSPEELANALVVSVIDEEKKRIEKQQQSNGAIYYPKDNFEIGQTIVFPALKWKSGIVRSTRKGFNPVLTPFDVIEVEFENGEKQQFAASYEDHPLNEAYSTTMDDPTLDQHVVLSRHKSTLGSKINQSLEKNKDLVRIAGKWFPITLLVDVNIGYLNLADALLDMENGGPLSTSTILDQIDLPTDVNPKLTQFSLNLALQKDERFDEVGPSGEVLWFLHRLEPAPVNNIPIYLKYNQEEIDYQPISEMLKQFDRHTIDELESRPVFNDPDVNEEIAISLIYPHWRSGTLPINQALSKIFPTAIESPFILFKFFDLESKNTFNGWVNRKSKYVYGLEEWYHTLGIIPGNIIYISKSTNSGEVNIRIDKRRPGREWVRTATINATGSVTFTMMKQMVTSSFDERMAFFIPDVRGIDLIWEANIKNRLSFERAALNTMLELAKLNPQGQVHAQELYAANNIIKRCPPGVVLNALVQSHKVIYLGDLYFRIDESVIEANHQ